MKDELEKNEWQFSIPLIWWTLHIHNKEYWGFRFMSGEFLHPLFAIHFERNGKWSKRIITVF